MVLNLFGFEEQNYDSGSKMGQPLNAILERVIFEISKGLDISVAYTNQNLLYHVHYQNKSTTTRMNTLI